MEYYALTGLTTGQLNMLFILVTKEIGSLVKPGAKKPPAVGLFDSVVMVVMLMRRNSAQAEAAAHFHCSQPTVSRRWDLLRPVIAKVLAAYVPGGLFIHPALTPLTCGDDPGEPSNE